MKKSLGIYIHIPFCKSKCRYCDFCSFPDKSGEYMRAYTDELCRRISERVGDAEEYRVDTVYLGGGTPSLLPEKCIEKIMNAVREYDLSPHVEITMECNPATADESYFYSVKNMGINRLSIGLQSACDKELELLGRVHTKEDFVRCFSQARGAGFDNISVDLMYGIPDQTTESFADSIEFLLSTEPEHISAYGLTVEDGTYFDKHRNELRLADDDTQAQMYCMLDGILEDYGYHKYEISNFSKAGRESRHNMRYWQCLEYLGFGVAAHSFFAGERFGNSRDIGAFIRGEDITEERYRISDAEFRQEFVMLGLRLARGIDTSEYRRKFGRGFYEDYPCVSNYLRQGFFCICGERIAFTEKGFLVSNGILSDMLDFSG